MISLGLRDHVSKTYQDNTSTSGWRPTKKILRATNMYWSGEILPKNKYSMELWLCTTDQLLHYLQTWGPSRRPENLLSGTCYVAWSPDPEQTSKIIIVLWIFILLCGHHILVSFGDKAHVRLEDWGSMLKYYNNVQSYNLTESHRFFSRS
jgi:hypothetical protein